MCVFHLYRETFLISMVCVCYVCICIYVCMFACMCVGVMMVVLLPNYSFNRQYKYVNINTSLVSEHKLHNK